MTVPRIVGDELITYRPDGPHLVGSQCRACGVVTFPRQGSCPQCTGEDVEDHVLARVGTLWGFTVQGFPPKDPYLAAGAAFQPYGVGYVDLGGVVLVEARLVADDWHTLRVGMPLELVIVPFHHDTAGVAAMTYAFAPVMTQEVCAP